MIRYLIIVVISFVSYCGALAQSPVEYNDKLIESTDSLAVMGNAWGNKLQDLYKGNKEFRELIPFREHIIRYIDNKLKTVKAMKDNAGSEQFRKAVIEYLVFERQMINGTFMRFEKFPGNVSDSEFVAAVKNLTKEAEKEDGYLQNVRTAQRAYAKKNNFMIEETQ